MNKDNKARRATDLVKQARLWKGPERTILIKSALALNPDCIEAYLLLGEDEQTPAKSEFWYRKAVAAGRRSIGNNWSFKKMSIFITALWNLAEELGYQDKIEEALEYYYELLGLQPEDELGIRYSLLRLLIRNEYYQEAREVIDSYENHEGNRWLYDDLLLSYLQLGSCDLVKKKAEKAIRANIAICQMLLEPLSLMEVHFETGSGDLGEQAAEAINYVVDTIELWNKDSSLLEWLHLQYNQLTNCSNVQLGSEVDALLRRGTELIETGDLVTAEEVLTGALSMKENLAIRNNLGYCQMLMDKFELSLATLRPGLTHELNPFGYALASESSYYLGNELAAHRYLRQAVFQFEQGFRLRELGQFAEQWNQYTVIIKAVAGLLKQDRLVMKLHKKWEPYLTLAEDIYQLGVAFFNRRSYRQACKIWDQLTDPEWNFLDQLSYAANVFAEGVIPAPRLEYLPPWYLADKDNFEEHTHHEMLHNYGGYRIAIISELFTNSPKPGDSGMIFSLTSVGEWGTRFGEAISADESLPEEWRNSAYKALQDKNK